jgi:beta-1,4-mannosyl-glycoprotein beta-1,4-N-acetylglucosaminyltransferase
MVYDCFTFFNELDILEIRLNVLDKVVDKFVLVEATHTHQGKEKSLYFNENKARYVAFADKIIHIIIDTFPKDDSNSSWTLERYQRDKIADGLKDAKPGDTVLISDVDEIPNPEQITAYKDKPGIKIFKQQMFYYFLNCRNISDNENYQWFGTAMTKYNPKLSPQLLRFLSIYMISTTEKRFVARGYSKLRVMWWKIKLMRNIYGVENGGWHFSFLGGVQMIIRKLEAFAHAEYNKEQYKDPKKIEEALDEGRDIFGRDFKYTFVPLDNTFPAYILSNKEKYKNLIREKSQVK